MYIGIHKCKKFTKYTFFLPNPILSAELILKPLSLMQSHENIKSCWFPDESLSDFTHILLSAQQFHHQYRLPLMPL